MRAHQLHGEGPSVRRLDIERRDNGKPQQYLGIERRVVRSDGLLPHDAFNPPQRRAGLAILDYEEGESI